MRFKIRRKSSPADLAFDTVLIVGMIFLVIVTLYPMLYALFASISDPQQLAQFRGILLKPLGFSTAAYKLVFKNPMIPTGYRNTLFYVVAGTTINMVMTTLGAYALSRRNVMWRRPITLMIIFTMFFSGGLIPTFLLVGVTLNMIDKPWALIIPPAINTWNLLIMKTGFEGVPVALEESAQDRRRQRLSHPVERGHPAVYAGHRCDILFYTVYHWNAFFNAMIYLRTTELWPLQLVLRQILIANLQLRHDVRVSIGGDVMPIGESIKYATIIVATVPILLLYPFLQRYFVKGVMIGAIKE